MQGTLHLGVVGTCVVGSLALLLGACGSSSDPLAAAPGPPDSPAPPDPPDPPPSAVALGDPIAGLTTAELEAFERGRALFSRRFTPSDGLGPRYDATSCESCHSKPVTGGSADLYRNFYVAQYGHMVQGSLPLPGLPSIVVPAFGGMGDSEFSLEHGRYIIPADVFGVPVRVAQRNSIPLFGTGMFEFVTDATILAHADPNDDDGDGISGRVNTELLGIGRLGTKAQANTVEGFTRAPLLTQMGITTDPVNGSAGASSLGASAMLQVTTGPDEPTLDGDSIPDPELSVEELSDLIVFTRFLAPPAQTPFNEAAIRGQAHFEQLGCVACHLPSIESTRGTLHAYTDLLIHDMGPDLADGIGLGAPQASSISPAHTGGEFRTQPLWGVGKFAPYLHDGRAITLHDAIRMHGGEASAARDAFLALSRPQMNDVVSFLEHL